MKRHPLAPGETWIFPNRVENHPTLMDMFVSYINYISSCESGFLRFNHLTKDTDICIAVVNPYTYEGTRPVFILESSSSLADEWGFYHPPYIDDFEDWAEIFPIQRRKGIFGWRYDSSGATPGTEGNRRARILAESWWQECGKYFEFGDDPAPLSLTQCDEFWEDWYLHEVTLFEKMNDIEMNKWWVRTGQQKKRQGLARKFRHQMDVFEKIQHGPLIIDPKDCGNIVIYSRKLNEHCQSILNMLRTDYRLATKIDAGCKIAIVFSNLSKPPKSEYIINYNHDSFSCEISLLMRYLSADAQTKPPSSEAPQTISEDEIFESVFKLSEEYQRKKLIRLLANAAIRKLNRREGWREAVPLKDGMELILASEDDCYGTHLPESIPKRMRGKSFKVTQLLQRSCIGGWWIKVRVDYIAEDGPIDYSEIIAREISRVTILVIDGSETKCQLVERYMSGLIPTLAADWEVKTEPLYGAVIPYAFTL